MNIRTTTTDRISGFTEGHMHHNKPNLDFLLFSRLLAGLVVVAFTSSGQGS